MCIIHPLLQYDAQDFGSSIKTRAIIRIVLCAGICLQIKTLQNPFSLVTNSSRLRLKVISGKGIYVYGLTKKLLTNFSGGAGFVLSKEALERSLYRVLHQVPQSLPVGHSHITLISLSNQEQSAAFCDRFVRVGLHKNDSFCRTKTDSGAEDVELGEPNNVCQ